MVEGGQLKSAHWGRELQGQASEQNNVGTLWSKGNVTIPTTINILGVATITASISFKRQENFYHYFYYCGRLFYCYYLLPAWPLVLIFEPHTVETEYTRKNTRPARRVSRSPTRLDRNIL